jgi:hypothetical protein
MILVVALIAVLAALSIPSLDSMYADYKVIGAVDEVRARWAQARAQAIDEGRPYRFAVVRNQGNFRVAPDSSEFWAGAQNAEETGGVGMVREGAIPKGIWFTLNNEEPVQDVGLVTALPTGEVTPDQWVGVVSFLPDGTAATLDGTDTEEIRITFQSKQSVPMLLTLRTLTGTVTVRKLNEVNRP